jgi:hypothetical protein
MGALEGGVELDPRTGVGEPHSELDVFDRGIGVTILVEAACRDEGVAAHTSEASPECSRATRARLVHMMVEQVSESRYGAGRLRGVVVGAEHGA